HQTWPSCCSSSSHSPNPNPNRAAFHKGLSGFTGSNRFTAKLLKGSTVAFIAQQTSAGFTCQGNSFIKLIVLCRDWCIIPFLTDLLVSGFFKLDSSYEWVVTKKLGRSSESDLLAFVETAEATYPQTLFGVESFRSEKETEKPLPEKLVRCPRYSLLFPIVSGVTFLVVGLDLIGEQVKPRFVVNKALEQVAYADSIIVNKIDLVSKADLEDLTIFLLRVSISISISSSVVWFPFELFGLSIGGWKSRSR
ncbi:hypothetical protein Ccrd_025316, partial [Cynara cardunculus var. scolymus]